ncbi:tungstate transport system substrate-binding protein [Maridesulfovibrio ferrireducens]|uniref:Tungstate transport system substrate-binding protein n=1 Tax=Maridesulfovibrio ferrireducens TaxID=246191 RepID=A0A1G9FI87_9BACT|nr:substrate-binding domain-containing protein [Maridesulfovibrio ferrireducens]SDK88086.1 tungstate transport system substrate-binding protein [Maridesulfovibrio ferrireducens]
MKKINVMLLTFALVALLVSPGLVKAEEVLMMATTTSTDNTGLLDELAPKFQKDTGIELRWTAVGTGKALKMGENCDVDVLLVHAPAAEQKYVDSGALKDRKEVMYNDFVIIGPASDPAGVKGLSVVDAMKTIASKKAAFVSRGDNSGTNKKEISLWKTAGMAVPDKDAWYVQTGQGMIKSINIAEERDGYIMTDRGTYIKYEANKNGNPELKVLVEGDKTLFNQYSVLAVNPEKCKNAKYALATKFSNWLTSSKAQKDIADFKLLGKKLFIPNAK